MIDVLLRYDARIINSRKIVIYTDENRLSLIVKLAKELNGTYKKCDPGSSIGCIQMEKCRVYVKPTSNPGIENERNFYTIVKQHIDSGCTRIKIGGRLIKGVQSIEMTGHDTKNNKKADMVLKTDKGDFPISIKKSNAERWASTDVIHGTEACKLLNRMVDKKIVTLTDFSDDGKVKRLSQPIARRLRDDEINHVVFGSDILGKGLVVVNSFTLDDFVFKRGTLHISGEVLLDSSDVKDTIYHPYMMIRNDACRRSKALPYGVRVEVVFESRITKNTIVYEE
ncbi:hypothetical protein VH12019_00281 [Vibrio phage VH1_2019]|uniref:Uncharacterized protein n=2 Tax=Schizotequatrovirus KVP40 TaxID=1914019 RepID=A0A6B9STA3_9CAUD|nr:hypothetical protein VH12019_00281 [Vibrio phage VH1_2019]QIW91018.1 hypothetical protein COHAPHLL_00155 [Vibrio phage V09]WOL24929.1 hypothetical protein [Vibrio phage PG216]